MTKTIYYHIYLLNFKILSVLNVFDGAESISTIKNTIQALFLQYFLNFFCPATLDPPGNSYASLNAS